MTICSGGVRVALLKSILPNNMFLKEVINAKMSLNTDLNFMITTSCVY